MSHPYEITTEGVKVAPPAVVSLLHMGGMTPADWVTVLTLLYLALQIGLLLPRYLTRLRAYWRRRRES
ncbi:hypothetical protein QT231_13725 [Halomonas sp. SpR1]|uniref:hypothetical protein n=1 Tax=unclassified Halomonas TaxID=2609666 RepID=UPI0007D8E99D|nr:MULTISPECIES: hypothetical protein [unclassified Halomonas]MBT2784822.1 hypothetical protein [Halomonas sp. ISL-106]MBT2796516.1 hypothetical protein [Halomonas sp. ISL-104]MDQ7733767.1 hypothetical protein [Halomonas sp. SpR1]OAL59762.1 hypothetical protein A6R74_00340 [Halomonas sp. ALS9]